MNTTTTCLDIDALITEIRACRQVQSWSNGSIRSRWLTELEEIIDAIDDETGEVDAALVRNANDKALRLATLIARKLAQSETAIERWISNGRRDGGMDGHRDGFETRTDGTVWAYATLRNMTNDGDYPFAEVLVDPTLIASIEAELQELGAL